MTSSIILTHIHLDTRRNEIFSKANKRITRTRINLLFSNPSALFDEADAFRPSCALTQGDRLHFKCFITVKESGAFFAPTSFFRLLFSSMHVVNTPLLFCHHWLGS